MMIDELLIFADHFQESMVILIIVTRHTSLELEARQSIAEVGKTWSKVEASGEDERQIEVSMENPELHFVIDRMLATLVTLV